MSFSSPNYKRKSLVAEIAYLGFISLLSPLAVGLQIFTDLSYTLSLVLINILNIPALVLFYRFYLPFTVGRKRYLLALLLFPVYILVYELNGRFASIAVIHLPFIPKGYQDNLLSGHPEDLTKGYFLQSFGYTCLVLLAATSLYVVKLLFRNQQHLYALETEKLKLELNHLKAQVQPHFFFQHPQQLVFTQHARFS